CGFNGENCTVLETSLQIPTSPDTGSETDISLTAPCTTNGYAFKILCPRNPTGSTANLTEAFHEPGNPPAQAVWQANNVDLAITFC
ncbi:hypothetical protein BD410DRAFT_686748, partial [Rickenella mellea]